MNKVKFSKDLNTQITTPKVRVVWANLTQPNTKFDANGVYDITVSVPDSEMTELKGKIDTCLARAEAEYKATYKKKPNIANSLPYKREFDKDTGEELPSWQLKVKLPAKTTVNGVITERKPTLVDSQLKPMSGAKPIGKGSIVRVNFYIYPYYVPAVGLGISAKLQAVQVIEFQALNGGNPLRGFSTEEGFVSEDVAVTEGPTPEVSSDSDF